MEENIKTFDVNFGSDGNWAEVATSIPLFMCMLVNSVTNTTVFEADINKLQDYSGKMTYDFNTNSVSYELIKKEVVAEEVTVEESN